MVFDGPADLAARIDDPALDVAEGDILLLKNAGPLTPAGMPEAGYLPIPTKLGRAGVKDMVRISDCRMSGTAFGTIVLHVTPEAAAGGPLALAETGDRIRLSVKDRKLDLLVDPAELARRQIRTGARLRNPSRGWDPIVADQVTQADRGLPTSACCVRRRSQADAMRRAVRSLRDRAKGVRCPAFAEHDGTCWEARSTSSAPAAAPARRCAARCWRMAYAFVPVVRSAERWAATGLPGHATHCGPRWAPGPGSGAGRAPSRIVSAAPMPGTSPPSWRAAQPRVRGSCSWAAPASSRVGRMPTAPGVLAGERRVARIGPPRRHPAPHHDLRRRRRGQRAAAGCPAAPPAGRAAARRRAGAGAAHPPIGRDAQPAGSTGPRLDWPGVPGDRRAGARCPMRRFRARRGSKPPGCAPPRVLPACPQHCCWRSRP